MASPHADVSASTQYNQIADAYGSLYPPTGESNPTYPASEIEQHQLYLAATDHTIDIRGKRILDLACGTGHNSSKFLAWGAASVTGVDISESMLAAAKAHAKARGIPESQMKFHLGDVTDTTLRIEGGPFDIVTGCWLLHYSPNVPTMTKMWTVIGNHLKPGGKFVGLTCNPLVSSQPYEGEMLNYMHSPEGPWGRHGTRGKTLETLPNGDGYKMWIELGLPEAGHNIAAFETYQPTLKVFQKSNEKSGLFDGLLWRDFVIPESVKQGRPVGFWNEIALMPYCRVCVATRV